MEFDLKYLSLLKHLKYSNLGQHIYCLTGLVYEGLSKFYLVGLTKYEEYPDS